MSLRMNEKNMDLSISRQINSLIAPCGLPQVGEFNTPHSMDVDEGVFIV